MRPIGCELEAGGMDYTLDFVFPAIRYDAPLRYTFDAYASGVDEVDGGLTESL